MDVRRGFLKSPFRGSLGCVAYEHRDGARLCQAESSVRPLRRRAERMDRPARVRIRKRKPCVFARRRLFGWKVRLLIDQLRSPVRQSDLPNVSPKTHVPPVWTQSVCTRDFHLRCHHRTPTLKQASAGIRQSPTKRRQDKGTAISRIGSNRAHMSQAVEHPTRSSISESLIFAHEDRSFL